MNAQYLILIFHPTIGISVCGAIPGPLIDGKVNVCLLTTLDYPKRHLISEQAYLSLRFLLYLNNVLHLAIVF